MSILGDAKIKQVLCLDKIIPFLKYLRSPSEKCELNTSSRKPSNCMPKIVYIKNMTLLT